jgi:hypothetical protein
VAFHQAAELRDLSGLVDAQIIEHEDLLVIERQFVGGAHDQRAVEALFELFGLI